MFAALHSDFNSLKYGLLHLTGQLNCRKGRLAKVKDGIISSTKFLETISPILYRYQCGVIGATTMSQMTIGMAAQSITTDSAL
jgi:hypothetical protein